MQVYFMSSSHMFTRVDISDPEKAFKTIRDGFDRDGYGSVFARTDSKRIAFDPMHGRTLPGGGVGATDKDIWIWLGRLAEFQATVEPYEGSGFWYGVSRYVRTLFKAVLGKRLLEVGL